MTPPTARHDQPSPDLHGFALGRDELNNVYGDHLAMFHHPAHKFHVLVKFDFSDKDRKDMVNAVLWALSEPSVLVNSDKKLLYDLIREPYVASLYRAPGSDLEKLDRSPHLEKTFLNKAAVILHEREFKPNEPSPNFKEPQFLLFGTKNPSANSSTLFLSRYMTVAMDYQQMFMVTVSNSVIPSGIDTKATRIRLTAPNGTADGSGLRPGQEVEATLVDAGDGTRIRLGIDRELWHDTEHYRQEHHMHDVEPMAELLAATMS